MERYLPCLYAFLACAGFSIVFEIKKPLFIFLSYYAGKGLRAFPTSQKDAAR